MQLIGHYLGWNFSSQFKHRYINLKLRTLKILIKFMVVFLCPKFIKTFSHGCFILKPAFMPCLSRSCAPFVTLLNIPTDSVGDAPHFWPHIVCCCDTVPCTKMLVKCSCIISAISIGSSAWSISLPFSVSLLLCECGFTYYCSLSLLYIPPHTSKKAQRESILRSIHPSKVAVNSRCLRIWLCLSENMNYRFSNESSVSTTESSISCLVLLH